MALLILMRHGQSEWNHLNQFTGWVDVPLSVKGIEEAIKGGEKIKQIPIDVIIMTSLIRSQQTAMLAMSRHLGGKTPVVLHRGAGKLEEWGKIYSEEAESAIIPVLTTSALNERMYGALQGLNKTKTAEKYGKEQVHLWRRSYDVAPPEGESLKETKERSLPYFEETIVPLLQEGKNVFVSAHGNSLRAIIMKLDSLTEDEVVHLEIPTGDPILYHYEEGQFLKGDPVDL